MKSSLELKISGISLADKAWGGLYPGGNYLLTGPHKSGRTIMSLQFAKECVQQKQVCLYFTTMRPKYLMISAASINFDLQQYVNQNMIILVRVSPPKNIEKRENSDSYLAEYMSELVELVEQYKPAKLVFDEFTPFVEFKNLENLKDSFLKTLEAIEEQNVTSLFILSEPATKAAINIVDAISPSATGVIELKRDEKSYEYYGGIMTITPNFGHTQGRFTSKYLLQPDVGIVTEFKQPGEETASGKKPAEEIAYSKLSEIKVEDEESLDLNFYKINDFKLVLNNQIAFINASNERSAILSIKITDELVAKEDFLSDLVKNVVRLSIDKKDKICFHQNHILIFIPKAKDEYIESLLRKVRTNISRFDEHYKLSEQIYYKDIFIDGSIKNSEDIFNKLSIV